jgi:hypothetical protein
MPKDGVAFTKPGRCSKCGLQLYCSHDVGGSGNDPVDDFRLFCPQCGEVNKFVHTDMGNDQETCPWCGEITDKNGTGQHLACVWYVDGIFGNTIKQDGNKIHQVDHVDIEEGSDGKDGNVYVAVCKETFNGWDNSASPIAKTGTLAEAKKTGLNFCEKCF